jgi:hypothetical protein
MPAITNATTTAGPASGTADDSTKKMPVPTVAPTPNIVSWNVPMDRGRCSPCSPAACWPPVDRTGLRRSSSARSPPGALMAVILSADQLRDRPLTGPLNRSVATR